MYLNEKQLQVIVMWKLPAVHQNIMGTAKKTKLEPPTEAELADFSVLLIKQKKIQLS